MLNLSRSSCVRTVLLSLLATLAGSTAKAQNPPSALDRQLARIDLGASGIGVFTGNVSGVNYLNVPVSQSASSSFGALITVRYTKSPYLGGEFNYTYARFTENYTNYFPGGVQTNASEYSLGYVAHPPHPIFGADPFIAAGAGSTAFRPTSHGGQGLSTQARATYYYNVGLEKPVFSEHFGLRVNFRQTFYLAPDYGQNFLTILKHTSTFEPGFGFYYKF
jgi:opacity protein-like surface antigen